MGELTPDPFRAARLILALRQQGITNPAVLKAMETMDRASFAAPEYSALAFADVHIPLACGQTIAPPVVTGQILSGARYGRARAGRALLVGAGSGYSTALLAGLVEHVVAAERCAQLAESARQRLQDLGVGNVDVRHADGLAGCGSDGPYDLVFLMGTVAEVPDSLFSVLAKKGEIIAPVGDWQGARLERWRPGRREASAPMQTPLLPLRSGLARVI